MSLDIVSHHFFRRRARRRARELNRLAPGRFGTAYRVAAAHRPPYRWYVVR